MINRVILIYLLVLPTVSSQGFARCRDSYFRSNGECLPCPDHCVNCSSNTNCNKCTDNYYGVTCQQTCPSPQRHCECHKIYGYCTYGCADGRFPATVSEECSLCPDNCDSCSSSVNCVKCKPRFYGKTCGQRCSTNCMTCTKSTGKCLVCGEGYFNKDGQCLRCPEACVGCYNNMTCSGCESGYLELDDGQCIKHCEMDVTNPCLNGQNGRSEGACGCAKNLIGKDVVIRTRQSCIRNMSCPSTVPCLTCGAMMMHQCTRTCRLEDEMTCSGESKCNVEEFTTYSLTICLNTKGAASVKIKPTTHECIPVAEDLIHDDKGNGSGFAVNGLMIVIIAIQTVMAVMTLMVFSKWKRKHNIKIYSSMLPSGTNTDNNNQGDGKTSLLHDKNNANTSDAVQPEAVELSTMTHEHIYSPD